MTTRAVVVQMECYTPQEVETAVREVLNNFTYHTHALAPVNKEAIVSLTMSRLKGERT
jgi:hypothetical protein